VDLSPVEKALLLLSWGKVGKGGEKLKNQHVPLLAGRQAFGI